MMLRSIDYIQSENKPMEWRLEGLTLRQINLIVGKNACGKSKALSAIGELAGLVSGSRKLGLRQAQDVTYSVRLVRDANATEDTYVLKTENARVIRESLKVDGEDKVDRAAGGAGRMYFDKLSQFLDFQSPDDELACVSRRDLIQHPYLENLYDWGHGSHYYRFNSLDLGKYSLFPLSHDVKELAKGKDVIDRRSSSWPVQQVFVVGAMELGDDFKMSLVSDMCRLGYPLEDVGFMFRGSQQNGSQQGEVLQGRGADTLACLAAAEDGLLLPIDQFAMSDGMFRTLAILVHVTYAAMNGKPSCVIIDDIGEGLDYERSCLLIKLLIEKAQKAGVQLIMATNDRFVMNNVPLEYWTVLTRERTERGTRVKVYNYETHKKIFDEFAYTGLNNFDFFATRFFEEGLGERA